jgi:hypothetical protein
MEGNSRTILPTRVIFTSDNGANKTGSNSPFSGIEGTLTAR